MGGWRNINFQFTTLQTLRKSAVVCTKNEREFPYWCDKFAHSTVVQKALKYQKRMLSLSARSINVGCCCWWSRISCEHKNILFALFVTFWRSLRPAWASWRLAVNNSAAAKVSHSPILGEIPHIGRYLLGDRLALPHSAAEKDVKRRNSPFLSVFFSSHFEGNMCVYAETRSDRPKSIEIVKEDSFVDDTEKVTFSFTLCLIRAGAGAGMGRVSDSHSPTTAAMIKWKNWIYCDSIRECRWWFQYANS